MPYCPIRARMLRHTLSLLLIAGLFCACRDARAEEIAGPAAVLSDATLVWHMGDKSSSPGHPAFSVDGAVTLGVELRGLEREASLQRGGDGKVAQFDGGYLRIGDANTDWPTLTGKTLTVYLRVRDAAGKWKDPLFTGCAKDRSPSIALAGVDGAAKPMRLVNFFNQNVPSIYHYLFAEQNGFHRVPDPARLIECTLGLDVPKAFIDFYDTEMSKCDSCISEEVHGGIMSVVAPVGLVGAKDWHDVILRFNNAKLNLFVDGVMIDEEFPVGAFRGCAGPLLLGAAMKDGSLLQGFQGAMDHFAIWGRALSDLEIAVLSGGKDYVAARQREVFPDRNATPQYARPPGLNIRVGDCIPYYENGVFHLFYLIVRRNHHSKWQCGHGGLQVAHAVTTDLIHWRNEELAIPITEQWEGFIGTGSCIFHNGQYYWFYPTMSVVGTEAPGGVYVATSKDCVHFDKQLQAPALATGSDNDVFWDKTANRFCMLSAGPKEADGRFRLDRYFSDDLVKWTRDSEPFLLDETAFGCPNYFEWNGWHYVLGQSPRKIWRSRQMGGPWTLQMPMELGLIKVPKVAAFGEKRRLIAGFLAEDGWGGDIVMWELVQREDGSLGTKFAPELIPASGEAVQFPLTPLTQGVSGDARQVRIAAQGKTGFAMLAGLPLNARVTLTVTPTNATGRFGLCFRGAGLYESGAELRFEPAAERVQFGVPANGGLAVQPSPSWFEGYVIDNVKELGRPFTLDIVIKDGIIDASIDQQRNIVTRTTLRGDRLFFFAEDTEVTFDSVSVKPLLDSVR